MNQEKFWNSKSPLFPKSFRSSINRTGRSNSPLKSNLWRLSPWGMNWRRNLSGNRLSSKISWGISFWSDKLSSKIRKNSSSKHIKSSSKIIKTGWRFKNNKTKNSLSSKRRDWDQNFKMKKEIWSIKWIKTSLFKFKKYKENTDNKSNVSTTKPLPSYNKTS